MNKVWRHSKHPIPHSGNRFCSVTRHKNLRLVIYLTSLDSSSNPSLASTRGCKSCNSFCPSLNAHLENNDRQSSWPRRLRLYAVTVPIISETRWLRVVTIILLPSAPFDNKGFNNNHFLASSFHTSSQKKQ